MDFRWVAKRLWLLSNMRQKLIDAWISAQDLQWVDFTNKDSVARLAQKIWPVLLKNNPQIAKQIKESWMLDQQTKTEVAEVIDAL